MRTVRTAQVVSAFIAALALVACEKQSPPAEAPKPPAAQPAPAAPPQTETPLAAGGP